MLFLLLALIITYAFFINKCDKKQKLLEEKEENIATFKKQERENETASLKKDKEIEKEILTLQHTIADLERNIQEGTKNQVVAKIEALQKKRQNSSHS
jgi:DNA mismatch repair ATPase MutS